MCCPDWCPCPGDPSGAARSCRAPAPQQVFVWLEQLIAANLGTLFPGMEVVESYAFRVIRDADIEIQEDEAADLSRYDRGQPAGTPLRLGRAAHRGRRRCPSACATLLMREPADRRRTMSMPRTGRWASPTSASCCAWTGPTSRIRRSRPRMPPALRATGEDIFAVLQRQDVLLHHPYDSFTPVVDLIQAAARDPQVLAIKQTLYRVGSHAPVVDALHGRRDAGQAGGGAGGAQGPLRRGEQHRVGARAGEGGRPCGLRHAGAEDACQDRPGRAQGARRHPPLRPPRHRQLQRVDRAHLHRPGPDDLPPRDRAPMPRICSTISPATPYSPPSASCWWPRSACARGCWSGSSARSPSTAAAATGG